jgi:hypothetical protein
MAAGALGLPQAQREGQGLMTVGPGERLSGRIRLSIDLQEGGRVYSAQSPSARRSPSKTPHAHILSVSYCRLKLSLTTAKISHQMNQCKIGSVNGAT